MEEAELRIEAVRRRLAGESAQSIATRLGRSSRWVRKWTARHAEEAASEETWAQGHSRAPLGCPTRTDEQVRRLIVEVRQRLTANPRSQYGALAIAWELRKLGVDPVPGPWTINRVIAAAGLARPRRRVQGYQSRGVPYPQVPAQVQDLHQVDMIGPRHLEGAVRFSALNLVDVGSHSAGSVILPGPRPPLMAKALVEVWQRVGIPVRCQMDNHSTFRGGIPPHAHLFGPVVATCLDLDVVPRFIPLREPWRNGVVEHFNDVWDKSFYRTARFGSIDELTRENAAFEAFHNREHRYSAHRGKSPDEMTAGLHIQIPASGYQPPGSLPRRGRIEVVRFIRSDQRLDLFGKKITLDAAHAYSYVTAIIRPRSQTLTVITVHGEIVHESKFPVATQLR
ncbi:MAG: hypothetical protein MUC45_11555 [Actinomycetia bacterium]|nr:hypothetical protein [Actinomycetes bacterium]